MAGGLFAKILNIWFGTVAVINIILFCAIVWEIFEYFFEVRKLPYNHSYRNNFFLDACGDVFGALLMAIIVVF
jgi:hypothetical protein